MACFIVAYDLNKQGQNYSCLTGKLGAMPSCHAQGSVWLVEYAGTETQLRDILMSCLDGNDRLLISEASKSWAGQNMPTCGKWLNDRDY